MTEVLGTVLAPSGRVVVFDVGLLGSFGRPEIDRIALGVEGLPTDRALRVIGRRLGEGRFGACWAEVSLEIAPGGVVVQTRQLGTAPVDCARLMFIDPDALDDWKHEESMDGLADFVFWGRDAELLASATGAPRTTEGFGWLDLPLTECVERGESAEGIKAKNGWLLRTDFRPHSHHFHVLAQIRSSATESGTVDLGTSRACAFATSWGDGDFPVHVDLDADERPVAVRIVLATSEAIANMDAVNT